MSVKLLTEQHLELLRLNEAAQARLCQHWAKCHIVVNHVSRLNFAFGSYRISEQRTLRRDCAYACIVSPEPSLFTYTEYESI